MTQVSKRRWFQFNLRTLFVLITLIACWLGYELNWIRQRRNFIAEENAKCEALQQKGHTRDFYVSVVGPGKSPGLLWLFGEPRLDHLAFFVETPMPEVLKRELDKGNPVDLNVQLEWQFIPEEGENLQPPSVMFGGIVPQPKLNSHSQERLSLALRLFPELPEIDTIHVMKGPGKLEEILIATRAR